MGARRWAGSEVWGHLGRELKQVISEGLLEQDGGGRVPAFGLFSVSFVLFLSSQIPHS